MRPEGANARSAANTDKRTYPTTARYGPLANDPVKSATSCIAISVAIITGQPPELLRPLTHLVGHTPLEGR